MPIKAQLICFPDGGFGHVCVKVIDTITNQELLYDWSGAGSIDLNAEEWHTHARIFDLPPTDVTWEAFINTMKTSHYFPAYSLEHSQPRSSEDSEVTTPKKINTFYIEPISGKDELKYEISDSSLPPIKVSGILNPQIIATYFYNRDYEDLSESSKNTIKDFFEYVNVGSFTKKHERYLIDNLIIMLKKMPDNNSYFKRNNENQHYSLRANNCAHAAKNILITAGYNLDVNASSSAVFLPESIARQVYPLSTQYREELLIPTQRGLDLIMLNWTLSGFLVGVALSSGTSIGLIILGVTLGLIIDYCRERQRCAQSASNFFAATHGNLSFISPQRTSNLSLTPIRHNYS